MTIPDVNYRDYADTKQSFFHTQKVLNVPYSRPFDLFGADFVKHEFLIANTKNEPVIVQGYAELKDGKPNEDYIYAYSVHKERRQSRVKNQSFDGMQFTYPIGCGNVYSSQWTYTFYRIPTKNVTRFQQLNNHFTVSTVSNAQRSYLNRRQRGYPEQQSNGWFPGSSLKEGLENIAGVIRGFDQKWLDYTDTKYIEVRIDRRDGGYIVKDMRGEPITDPDKLRNIFSGIARPRATN